MLLKQEQQCFALELLKAEVGNVGRRGRVRSGDVHGCVAAIDDAANQVVTKRRHPLDLGISLSHGLAGRGGHRSNASNVLCAASSAAFLAATVETGHEIGTVSCDQQAHTLWSTKLVGAQRNEICSGAHLGDINPAERLHGVGVEKRRVRGLGNDVGDGLDRLEDAGLVVDRHDRNQPDVVMVEQASKLNEVDNTVEPNRGDDAVQVLDWVEHGMVFGGRTQHGPIAGFSNAENREVVGLGATSREHDVARLGPNCISQHFASLINDSVGFTGHPVSPGRVAEPVAQQRHHGIDRSRAHGRGRRVIQVVSHSLQATGPTGHPEARRQRFGVLAATPRSVPLNSTGPNPEIPFGPPSSDHEFSHSTYGDSFADVYDDWYHDITDAKATATFVAGHCVDGPIVELGVGTGRLVDALIARDLRVIGLDASSAMLSRCQPRPGLSNIRADMAALPFAHHRSLGGAICAFNTLFNLSATAQGQLFATMGSALKPDAALIIEAITGAGLGEGPADSVGISRIDGDQLVLAATRVDAEAQTIVGQHVDITEGGIRLRPWQLRWTTPTQLDELAQRGGLQLAHRVADWSGNEFTDESDRHVSVYRPTAS